MLDYVASCHVPCTALHVAEFAPLHEFSVVTARWGRQEKNMNKTRSRQRHGAATLVGAVDSVVAGIR